MGGFDGKTRNENSYEIYDDYGPEYENAYVSVYVEPYNAGYDLGFSHKNNITEKAEFDAKKYAYNNGYSNGNHGAEYDDDPYLYEEDWMIGNYVETYTAVYKSEYKRGYEDGASVPEEPEEFFPDYKPLYHLASLVKNAEKIRNGHLPQVNLEYVHDLDSYYSDYDLTEGANQSIDNGDEEADSLTFKTSGHLEKLVSVQVDGVTLSENDYELKNGSTIVTLKDSFLKTLSAGRHTLKLVYIDNVIETTFNVEKSTSNNTEPSNTNNSVDDNETTYTSKNESNPRTEDTIMFYMKMLVLSIIGLVGTIIYIIKENNTRIES